MHPRMSEDLKNQLPWPVGPLLVPCLFSSALCRVSVCRGGARLKHSGNMS